MENAMSGIGHDFNDVMAMAAKKLDGVVAPEFLPITGYPVGTIELIHHLGGYAIIQYVESPCKAKYIYVGEDARELRENVRRDIRTYPKYIGE